MTDCFDCPRNWPAPAIDTRSRIDDEREPNSPHELFRSLRRNGHRFSFSSSDKFHTLFYRNFKSSMLMYINPMLFYILFTSLFAFPPLSFFFFSIFVPAVSSIVGIRDTANESDRNEIQNVRCRDLCSRIMAKKANNFDNCNI